MRNVIGVNIKRIRKEKNLTQEELSARLYILGLNIDRPMISKIENQQREITDIEILAFAKTLSVSIENLFKTGGDT